LPPIIEPVFWHNALTIDHRFIHDDQSKAA